MNQLFTFTYDLPPENVEVAGTIDPGVVLTSLEKRLPHFYKFSLSYQIIRQSNLMSLIREGDDKGGEVLENPC